VATFVGALAVGCLTPGTADAAVLADFTDDSAVDRVQIHAGSDHCVLIRVPGLVPQELRVHERLLSVVAVDVNHDGRLDVGAWSERRGLLIWLNRGHGHFKALKKKHITHHGPVAHAARRMAPSEKGTPLAQDGLRDAKALRVTRGDSIGGDTRCSITLESFCHPIIPGTSTPSTPRAPPLAL